MWLLSLHIGTSVMFVLDACGVDWHGAKPIPEISWDDISALDLSSLLK